MGDVEITKSGGLALQDGTATKPKRDSRMGLQKNGSFNTQETIFSVRRVFLVGRDTEQRCRRTGA